jgi:hypothetical protein
MSPVVNRRKLLEAVSVLCRTSSPNAGEVNEALKTMGAVVSDIAGEPVRIVVMAAKKSATRQ